MKSMKTASSLLLLVLLIGLPSISMAASTITCSSDLNYVSRTSSSFVVKYFTSSSDAYLNQLSTSYFQLQSSFFSNFSGTVSCTVPASGCLPNVSTNCASAQSVSCTLSGQYIKVYPWTLSFSTTMTMLQVQVTFSSSFSAITPTQIGLATTIYSSSTLINSGCTQYIDFSTSTPLAFTMKIQNSATAVVLSTGIVELTYQPGLNTYSNQIEVRILKTSYSKGFYDTDVANKPWDSTSSVSVKTASSTLFTSTSIANSSCLSGTTTYYCMNFQFTQMQFLSSTTYTITITSFQFPFHPLGIDTVQILVLNSNYETELGTATSTISSSSFTTYPSTVSSWSGSSFCTGSSCTVTGVVGKTYTSMVATVTATLPIISGSKLMLSFPTGMLTIAGTVSLSVAGGTSVTGVVSTSSSYTTITFTSAVTSNTVKASSLAFTILTPTIGLSSSSYPVLLQSLSVDTSSVTHAQFDTTFNYSVISANTFTSVVVDTSTVQQIGTTQGYTFKLTPSSSIKNNSQMWFTVVYPTGYAIATATSNCYAVTTEGTSSLTATSYTVITRSTSSLTVSIAATFSTTGVTVTAITLSICAITNPSQTGSVGPIAVSAYYESQSYVSETGSTYVTISTASFGAGSTIALLDTSNKTTQVQNGYIIQLVLPVAQAVGNFISLTFPDYLSNFVITSSSSTYLTTVSSTSSVGTRVWIGKLTSALAASSTLDVRFTGYNPPYVSQTYSFLAQMMDSTSKVQLQSTLTLSTSGYTATTASLVVNRGSTVNGAATTFYFVYTIPHYVVSNIFYMRIQISTLQTITSLLVKETNSKFGTSLVYSLSSDLQYIEVTGTLISTYLNNQNLDTSVSFEVSTLTNYISLKPISLSIITGSSIVYQGSVSSYVTAATNTLKSLASSATKITSISPQWFATSGVYTITISLGIAVPNSGKLDIFTNLDLSSYFQVITSDFTLSSSGSRQMRLICIKQTCQSVSLQLTSLVNPTYTVFTSSTFSILNTIVTYDSGTPDYSIEQTSFTTTDLPYYNTCFPNKTSSIYCKECNSSATVCSSCYTTAMFNSVAYDKLEGINSTCVATCPTGTYTSGYTCPICTNNCKTCSSATSCITCNTGYSLQGSSCQSSCNTGYYSDSSSICQVCNLTQCSACTGSSTNCTACNGTQGLITLSTGTKSCVSCSSTDGYYSISTAATSCGVCSSYCSACSGTSTTCSACVATYNSAVVYYNPQTLSCGTSCETGYSVIKDTSGVSYCGLCATGTRACSKCLNTTTYCIACSGSLYLYNNACVALSEIPTGYFGNSSTNTADRCPTACKSCESSSVCTACVTNYFLVKGACLSSCPSDLPVADGSGGCTTSSSSTSSLSDNRIVPFPMLLSSIAFSISVYFSKYEYPTTFVPGCIVGFCSFFEWVSWIIQIFVAGINDGVSSTSFILTIFAFILLYVVNILSFIYTLRVIEPDLAFKDWTLQSPKNSLCYRIIKWVALFTSFKAQRVIFSKYFNQSFFKGKLSDIDLFHKFNVLSLVSVIVSSFLIIIASALLSYNYGNTTQAFFLALDTLIVTILMILFMIWDALKKKDFFDESHKGLEYTFSQRFFPFDQSYVDKIQKRDANARLRLGESNSNLSEFSEDRKASLLEPVQKPLSQVLDPSDISPNANIDKNILKNYENGAPYLISDEIQESYTPSGKRIFDKKHVGPIFDYKKYEPIPEHPDEEDDRYDEENSELKFKSAKSPLNMSQQQSILQANMSRFQHPDGQDDEDEPVPVKPNMRHTIYFNDNPSQMSKNPSRVTGINASGVNNTDAPVSLGVNINQDEDDQEVKDLRSKLYSKPDGKISKNSNGAYDPEAEALGAGAPNERSKPSKTKGSSKVEATNDPKKKTSPSRNSPSGKNSPGRSTSKSPSRLKSSSPNNVDGKNGTTSKQGGRNSGVKSPSPKQASAHPENELNNSKGDYSKDTPFGPGGPGNQHGPKGKAGSRASNSNKAGSPGPGGQGNSDYDENNPNRVERILPVIEDLDRPDHSKGGLNPAGGSNSDNNLKMKGPVNDRASKPKNNAVDALGASQGGDSPDKNKYIFDSNESVHTAEEAEMNYNEISPSDFNVLNQRYEEDYFAVQINQQMQQQSNIQNMSRINSQPQSGFQSGGNPAFFDNNPDDGLGNSRSNASVGLGQGSNLKSGAIGGGAPAGAGLKNSKIKGATKTQNSSKIGLGNSQIQRGRSNSPTGNSQTVSGPFYGGPDASDSFNANQTNSHLNRSQNNRSNSGLRSNGQLAQSNSAVQYKVPPTDTSKLRNLEKIYLQRLEGLPSNSNKPGRTSPGRKPKRSINDPGNDNDSNLYQSQNLAGLQNNGSPIDVADFGDDNSYKNQKF